MTKGRMTQEDIIKHLSAIKLAREMTNKDKMLEMSDEEKADWANAIDLCELCAYEPKSTCEKEPCVNGELKFVPIKNGNKGIKNE